MAAPLPIFPGIIPRPRQVPDGLVLGCRWLHRREQPRAPELRQLAGIAAIRLHSLTGLPRNQRGRHHVAADTRRRHLPLQRIPTRSGFIKHAHRARRLALELPDQATHRPPFIRQLPRHGHRLRTNHHRDEQVLLMRVDPNVRDNVFHDRLPSMRLWRSRALTRDSGGSVHRVECLQHYNVTMESRSFRIV
jgi:hypothetical protein